MNAALLSRCALGVGPGHVSRSSVQHRYGKDLLDRRKSVTGRDSATMSKSEVEHFNGVWSWNRGSRSATGDVDVRGSEST